MQEAAFITSISGYIGILLGILILEFYNSGLWLEFFQSFGMMQDVTLETMEIFYKPSIDIKVALNAMLLLVIAGGLAGYVPARRAAKIRPIEALREE